MISWQEFMALVPSDRERILSVLWETDESVAAQFSAELMVLAMQKGDAEASEWVTRAAKRMDVSRAPQRRCDLCGKKAAWMHHRLCPNCWKRWR